MYDAHGRQIDYMRVSIIDRCNLRCVYCMPDTYQEFQPFEDLLSYDEFLTVLRAAIDLGITRFRITGGEPTVRAGLVDFMRRVTALEGLQDVALSTNGLRFKDLAPELYEAGLRRVNVSLDTLRADRFREITRWGDISDVVAAFDVARAVGYDPIKLNAVVMRGVNDDEVFDLVEFALEKQVKVRFIELMPLGTAYPWAAERWVPTPELIERLGTRYDLEPLENGAVRGYGPADYYRVNGGAGVIGFISPFKEHFCQACRRIRLSADGKIYPCLAWETAAVDLKPALRRGAGLDEIRLLLARALEIKPPAHMFEEYQADELKRRVMSRIGG